MQTHITGRNAFDGQGVRLTIEGQRIVVTEPVETGDEELAWIAPGFVDLQVNGYAGEDFNGEGLDVETVVRAVEHILSTGVTTFLPTLITASEERLLANLAVVAEARRQSPMVAAAIPCVHLEGPWISPEDGARGAHPLEHVREPDMDEFARWQRAADNLIGLVTMSPHWQGSETAIAALVMQGVRVSLGHTHASSEQIHAAAQAGATLSTHLGNGIATMLARHPNPIWAQLADDRLSAMFLADGHHLPLDTLVAMLRSKGRAQSILASDLVALAGMSPGIYDVPVGGRVELSVSGRLHVAGTDLLAGATATLPSVVALVANLPGFSLADAVKMATLNPCEALSLRCNTLEPDGDADLLQFHWSKGERQLRLKHVWKRGVLIRKCPA